MKLIIFGLIILFILIFIACAIIFPELVGVGGKKAQEIESRHRQKDEDSDHSPV